MGAFPSPFFSPPDATKRASLANLGKTLPVEYIIGIYDIFKNLKLSSNIAVSSNERNVRVQLRCERSGATSAATRC